MASWHYRLAGVTTALTFLLILVGEFTAVSASGATCGLDWPSCSGQFVPFGLPLHDLIEWGHRAFAGIVGLFILAAGALAWRRYDDRGVRWSALAAVLILPTQVILGGITVTLGGLVPWGYAPVVQAAHHVTGLLLYAALVVMTLQIRRADGRGVPRPRPAATVGLATIPVEVALSRRTLFNYVTPIQLAHHAAELVILTAAIVVVAWAFDARDAARPQLAAGGATVLVTGQILLGVGIVQYSRSVQMAYYVLAGGVTACLLAVLWTTGGASGTFSTRGTVRRTE